MSRRRGLPSALALMVVCTLLACSSARAAAPGSMSIQRVDLDTSGVGYPVYRIPALVVTNAGTLIAAYDGRPTMADVPSNIALLVRRSVDDGAT
jgi:sialidase-1